MNTVLDFLDFVSASPTAFHAVHEAVTRLERAGFTELDERKPFSLVPGGKYYLTRNRSGVLAFRLPEGELTHFQIVASHADSPCFKLKTPEESDAPGDCLRLNVEGYGGMIMSTWLDRPLSVAGRLLLRTEGGLETRLCDLRRDAVLIPNLPIHFNREVNKAYAFNAQVDMQPLCGGKESRGLLLRELAEGVGARAEDIAACDLFLYNRMPGSIWGAQDEFFSAPRIDDLQCAHASLAAFLAAPAPEGHADVYALFDNEEVGSGSKQGADSNLLSAALRRVSTALGADADAVLAGSFTVSADNAHAVHPNHPEKYDDANRCRMNGGVVIKHNAAQKYTTDAASDAVFSEVCRAAGVPVQHFFNRADVPGGSTLGHIANTHASMNSLDIGLAQLAMHSSYETAGTADPDYMVRALTAFYGTDVRARGDGDFELVPAREG